VQQAAQEKQMNPSFAFVKALSTPLQAMLPFSSRAGSHTSTSGRFVVFHVLLACLFCCLPASSQTITVNASSGVAINSHVYGANNIWYYVPENNFYTANAGIGSYVSRLTTNAGVTYLRYPGGFESENYEWFTGTAPDDTSWSENTLDTSYRNYTPTQSASPAQVISAMGGGNASFVVRTGDALHDYVKYGSSYVPTIENWAGVAANQVTLYCQTPTRAGITDWQLGNEWYNGNAASQGSSNYTAVLNAYAQIIFYYAQSMQAAAVAANCKINIYVTSNWASPYSNDGDMSTLKSAVKAIPAGSGTWSSSGVTVWANDVNGADIHAYTGVNPCQTNPYPEPAISHMQTIIGNIKRDSGMSLVYASEWAADLGDNDVADNLCTGSEGYTGLQNSNIMLQIMGQFAQSGITAAAYWAPVYENVDTGCQTPIQANAYTLVSNSTTYTTVPNGKSTNCIYQSTTAPYSIAANGQAMQLLSSTYLGQSLATVSAKTNTQSIAAINNGQIVVFLMTKGAPLTENDLIQVTGGPAWTKVVSAHVMYAASGQSITAGPVTVAPLATSLFTVVPGQSVSVPLQLGGTSSSWEIIQLTLGN
jgi:hypothetical protein